MNLEPVDVGLVCMPFAETAAPSLALGLLKADCDKHGVSSRVVQPNLWFCEEIGPAIYDLIFGAYDTTILGEWIFSGVLFPGFEPDHKAYLEKVTFVMELDAPPQWQHITGRYPSVDVAELLLEVRRSAGRFVDRVADRVLAMEPRIVGCSSTFQQHCASLALLRVIKQRRPDLVTMIGGANCEGDMARATFEQCPWVDYAVSGEADGFFGAMCERLLADGPEGVAAADLPEGVWAPPHRQDRSGMRPPPLSRSDLTAISFVHIVRRDDLAAGGAATAVLPAAESAKRGDGAPIALLEDMNESPVPNFDDYFADLSQTQALRSFVKATLPYQTARGCWWGEKSHCSFCGISRTSMKFRAKTSDNVIEQLVAMRDRYGIPVFQGNEYIFDYRYFQTLLPRLRDYGFYFRFEVKANLKPEQLQAFADAGVLEVQPGIESLHDDILALIKKGVTAAQNIVLLKRARKIGLSVSWNLLHHIPGDRDAWYGEMADLVPLLTHLQSPYGFSQIHYDRFSPYWRDPAGHGLELLPAWGYDYVYPYPLDVKNDIVYFFETPWQRQSAYRWHREREAGLLRLLPAVKAWKEAWGVPDVPQLTAQALDGRTEFIDTRPIALAPSFAIEGLEHRVYRAAEDGIVPATLAKTLHQDAPGAYTDDDIDAAVSSLIEKKVIVRVSGRLLSLGVAAPVPEFLARRSPLPKALLNPHWARLQADVALDEQRPNLALSCLRMPDQPLSAWLAPGA